MPLEDRCVITIHERPFNIEIPRFRPIARKLGKVLFALSLLIAPWEVSQDRYKAENSRRVIPSPVFLPPQMLAGLTGSSEEYQSERLCIGNVVVTWAALLGGVIVFGRVPRSAVPPPIKKP